MPAPSFPIGLSLKVALIALAVVGPIGVALAHLQARRRYRGHTLVDARQDGAKFVYLIKKG